LKLAVDLDGKMAPPQFEIDERCGCREIGRVFTRG
jgi:hypothetical protein